MKTIISDALQVIAAILLTTGVLVSAAPLPPKEAISDPQSVVKVVDAKEHAIESSKPASEPEMAKKEVSDPNGCEPEQYWDKEPPHKCIAKPTSSPSAEPVVTKSQPVSAPSGGNCDTWKAAAGIPSTYATNKLINNESGCRPNAINPSSGACGIAQELLEPHQSAEQWASVNAGYCPKSKCTLQDPVCQLRWMNGYVSERYTTWEGALSFWQCIGRCSNNYGTITKTATWY